MLEIKDLTASAGDREILHGITLTVRPGEIHAVMGPNGSGKSTLAQVLAGHPAYEVTGGATFKSNVQTIVGDLIYHQNGANGQLPANRIDGGLYHTGAQHDVSEASSPNVLIASSWMSALLVDPMVRAYGVWQNPQIADFVVRLGNFEKVASKTDANGLYKITKLPAREVTITASKSGIGSRSIQRTLVGGTTVWGSVSLP